MTDSLAEQLRTLAEDRKMLYEVPRRKIEDELIDFRDSGISMMGIPNGLVVRYPDGTPSDAIRMSVEEAVRLALRSIADHLDGIDDDNDN